MSRSFLVRLDNADIALSGRIVLHNINWLIETNQCWRVDGQNGSGKTTLLKTIAGLLWPVAKNTPSRLYRIDGKTTHLLAGVRQNIGFSSYGMQDEYVRGARNISCYEVIASGFEQGIMVYDQLSEKQELTMKSVSSKLGLLEILDNSFLSISHGQKSAVLFARALINQPKLLILDEIFNGVDQTRFELMIELLHDYKRQGGQLILSWHEHGVSSIEELFTHRLKLDKGKIVSIGQNIPTPIRQIKASNRRHKPNKQIGDYNLANKLIELKNLDVYLQNKHILKNINWTICRGECWLLKGENGAGKTTLLRTLLAEVRPAIGSEVWRSGFDVRSSVWQIRQLIGYVSPELQQAYHYNISVSDAVASGFFSSIGLYDEINQKQQQQVKRVLSKFDLVDLENMGVHQISSGQMRRVLIARALVLNPKILIFDEITANLDQHSKSNILRHISYLLTEGRTMILVGHHATELVGLYNRVLYLHAGKASIEN